MIDRKAPRGFSIPEGIDERIRDRFKYDDSDDSESEHPTYIVDPHSEE